jgi:small-conductance mechanosensitive channel
VTRDNKSYLVPNEEFITQQVINWSHGNTLVRVDTFFGVHYDSDPHEVKRLATEAASKPDRIVDSPSPVCHLIEFGDNSLNFVLRYWIKDAEKGLTNTKGDVMLALWDTLKEHKIDIPYPHREVFLHNKN